MGVYTSEGGIAVALASGTGEGRVTHASWHPSLKREEDRVAYPAEEIFELKKGLSPDTIILYDTVCPLSPFFMALPRLKPRQVTQALMMELETRNVPLLVDPVPGFCLNRVSHGGARERGVAGFGLVADGGRYREALGKHRPLGIQPDFLTLPIIPLAFYAMKKVSHARCLLFLIDGPLIMIAGIAAEKIAFLEVLVGDEADLTERIETHLRDAPGSQDIFGFEIHAPSKPRQGPGRGADVVFAPLQPGATMLDRVRKRSLLPPEAVAGILARLPFVTGSALYGGIRVNPEADGAGKQRPWLRNAGIAAGLVLLGLGAILGIRAFNTRAAYLRQKRHVRQELKSVLPGLPSVASLSLLKSKLAEAKKVRGHLDAFFAPSTLTLSAKILPLLDKLKGVRILEIQTTPETIRVVFQSSKMVDEAGIKALIIKNGGMALDSFGKHEGKGKGTHWLYTLKVKALQPGSGGNHAE